MVIGSAPHPLRVFRSLLEAKWDNWICIEEAGRQGAGRGSGGALHPRVWGDTPCDPPLGAPRSGVAHLLGVIFMVDKLRVGVIGCGDGPGPRRSY
jgi:hypothetical protein